MKQLEVKLKLKLIKKKKKQDDILGEIQLVEEKERIDYCGYILLTWFFSGWNNFGGIDESHE